MAMMDVDGIITIHGDGGCGW